MVWRVRGPERRPLLRRELAGARLPAVRRTQDTEAGAGEAVARGNYCYKNKPLFRGQFNLDK